jgi:hypothetical protein
VSFPGERVAYGQPILDPESGVHVLGPQDLATGHQRGRYDHAVIDRKAMPLAEPQLARTSPQAIPVFRRATLASSFRTWTLIVPPSRTSASARFAFRSSPDRW